MKKILTMVALAACITSCSEGLTSTQTISDSTSVTNSTDSARGADLSDSAHKMVVDATNVADSANKMMDKAANKMEDAREKMKESTGEARDSVK